MEITLERFSYSPTETEGTMRVGDVVMHTIERPWIPFTTPGGRPGTPGRPDLPASCVPDGVYKLEPWSRPSGAEVYILCNEELGVYRFAEDVPPNIGGRFLILVHIANWVSDVIGCVGPGLSRGFLPNPKTGVEGPMVTSSAVAMGKLRAALGRSQSHVLKIVPKCGTQTEVR